MAVLALPAMLVPIDVSVMILALPHIGASLGADSAQQLWIMDIYGFMLAGFMITMGTLGDRIGRRKLLMIGAFQGDGFGYFQMQATRPQTVGYTLADSPAAQAAWIYGQFEEWTDNTEEPESALTRDQMLDDITLYWLTNTSASSARMYLENAAPPSNMIVDLPVGCSIFPHDVFRAPRSWAERCYPHLIYWNEVERGGHFAAFEQPTLFIRELRACFRLLR